MKHVPDRLLSFSQPGLDLLRTTALKTSGLLASSDFVNDVRQSAPARRARLRRL
jgi:hypothetical protein